MQIYRRRHGNVICRFVRVRTGYEKAEARTLYRIWCRLGRLHEVGNDRIVG